MVFETIMPVAGFAKEITPEQNNLVKVGTIDIKSYPQIDAKIAQEANRRKKQELNGRKMQGGVQLFSSPYFPGQDPTDNQKPLIFANVNAIFTTKGLDGGNFNWEGVFGKDSDGKLNKAQIVFEQLDDKTSTGTGIKFFLKVDKDGIYTWSDSEGNPTKLPLYSKELKPFKYEVKLDEDVSEHVKLLTARFFGTSGGYAFGKPDPVTGEIVGNINLDLSLQQIASTKFTSKWNTGVVEADRPTVEGSYLTGYETDPEDYGIFKFPSNDTDKTIIRNDQLDPQNPAEYSEYLASELDKTPKVGVADPDPDATDTYTLDRGNKKISYKGKNYKYDFTYDVINGGKLTMTEILPVTFDANGGKFASVTDPNAEQKIVKEVEYDGTLTDKAETPTKPGKAFKGWATDANGTTPAPDSDYENLKAAKTFYAIWSDEDIQAEELATNESLIRFRKNGPPIITNDFVPTFEDLKAQVKVKDANGNFVALPTTGVTFTIVDDKGTVYDKDSVDLKKFIYDKGKEKNIDEVSRTETVKAKITYSDGTTREIDIPIKVLKNIYRGSDQGGRLPHIPENYVKVTIDPTDKAQDPQKTYYYVNPKAKVIVPVTDPVGAGDNKFSKWTMKADSASGDGADYTKANRYQFTEDTTITAQYGAGIIKIVYVDQNGDEIDAKYQIAGQDYPSDNSGGLGKEADELKFASKGPDFKGYIYSSRDSIKGKYYKDPKDPDNLDIVKYSYFKKVTTKEPTNKNVYFPVIFDANGGEFKPDTVTQKTVYVYFDGNNATVEKVTFKEVKDEFEKAYSNPTKDGFDFKEWQNAKTNGTKPADNYEIQFKGWDPSTYTAKKEIFYAYYEQASAKIAYLDLDGKPIADEFKIDGVEYPTEKEGKLDEAIAPDVFTKDTAPKLIGYKFNRIEINPVNSKYALDNKGTIKIYYEKLPDVIPAKDGSGNPNEKPVGYVEVKFVPTDKAKDTTEKIFYVNPKKDVTIPIADPVAKATYTFKEWKMGADAKGAVYTPSTAQKFTEPTTVITATYEETENIIPYDPSATDPMPRPEGYVRVTFAADPGLKLTEQKAYYVKANAGITLADTALVKPKYDVETGYKFDKWNKEDSLVIEATDIVVTAKATALDEFIPQKNTDGSDKPEGYVTVTFVADTNGEIRDNGTKVDKKVYYVNPKKFVKLPAPTPVGDTGYDFAAWSSDQVTGDFSLANYINYTEDTVITAKFNQKDAVYPKLDGTTKPAGYVEVTFKVTGTDGKIADKEITTYYVDPNREVSLKDPKTIAGTGFIFDGWRLEDNTTAAKINPADKKYYQKDTTIYGSFKKLDDIIPATNDDGTTNLQPEDYVAVLFIEGEHAEKLEGQVLYYVNPKAGKTIGDLTQPKITPDTGWNYKGWDKADTTEIKDYMFVIAQYEAIPDVIEKIDANTKKPDGYVTVTFNAGDNGKLEGITEKVYYVNPNVYVKLDAPNTVPDTGYEFGSWKSDGKVFSLDNFIKYEKDTTITANFNLTGNVIPKTKPDDSEKPAGFVTVNFVIDGQGGQIEAGETITYFVKKGEAVTIHPPKTKAEVGYEFDNWDKDTTTPTAYTDEETTVKGSFKKLDDIIKSKEANGTINAKPEGYVTVQFLKGDHGVLDGQTTFYVNPKAGKKLEDLKPEEITIVPEKTYKFDKWDKELTTNITGNIDVTAEYTQLPNIIKAGPKDRAPVGYVVIIFETDGRGTITGNAKYEEGNTPQKETEIVYFVNPDKNVKLAAADATASDTVLPVPSTTPYDATKYQFDQWRADIDKNTPITRGRVHIAMFKPKQVTLTYDANGATEGTAPAEVKVDYNTNVRLANQGDLVKKDASFAGWTIDGKDYKIGDEIILTKDSKAIAKWTDDRTIIPYDPKEPITRPDDTYVRVTFEAETGLKLTEQKAYYVKKNAKDADGNPITLGNSDLVKPKYDVDTGYKFDKWDPADTTIIADKDVVVKAKATKLPTVIPEKDANGTPNDKPAGYKEVTFVIKSGDETKGSIEGVAKFYVNPTEYVTITPPATKANTGYEFGAWDKDATIPTAYKDDVTTITGSFNELKAVISKTNPDGTENTKPEGYKTVTFVIEGQGGKIADKEVTIYYVNPAKDVTVPQPRTIADIGYIFEEWDQDTVTTAKKYTEDTTVKGNFKKLEDVIPSTDDQGKPNAKPKGYVRVDVIPTYFAKDPTIKSYWVNPNKEVTIPEMAIQPLNDNFKFLGWDQPFTQQFEGRTNNIIAKFEIVSKPCPPTPPTPDNPDNPWNPNYPNKPYIPSYPEVRYETIVQEKIVKVPVSSNAYFKEVRYMQGFRGEFRPKDGLTRAEAAQILANALKEDGYKYDPNYKISYKDIGNAWYTEAVKIVTQANVFKGYDDGNFKPQEKITRAEWIGTLKRFQELSDLSGNHMNLREGHWAMAEIEAAYQAGWLAIYSDGLADFKADEFIPRQEVAAVSNKAFERVLDKTYIKRNDKTLVNYKDINDKMWSYEDILCASNTFLHDKKLYRAHGIDMSNEIFNINVDGFTITKDKFQRIER